MPKSLVAPITALAFALAPIRSVAQSLPITVGMNYGDARQRLIQAGWQPLMPGGARALWASGSAEFMNLQMRLAAAFRQRGWHETLGCAPTGLGTCQHQFFDVNRRGLIVETGSGGYGVLPSVTRFYYRDGTRYSH